MGIKRVDGLDAGLDRRVDRLALDDAGRHAFDGPRRLGVDRALVIDRFAQRVNHAADELHADRHLDDAAGRLDRVAFLDLGVIAQNHRADCLFLEVQRHAHDATREFEQLGRQGAFQAVDLGDAVADLHDRADRARLDAGVELVDRRLDDGRDVVGTDGHCGISC
jgi:hypothetical protein